MTDQRTAAPVSPVRIAVVQLDPRVGVERLKANAEHAVEAAGRAVAQGADVVVLPELATTGYSFENRAEAYAHAEPVPDGDTVRMWEAFAAEHGVHVVAGLAERDGVRLYDTAVLVGPDGYVGRYRKTHLWYREKLWFTPGDEGFPVFETPIGRIGLLICWDIWFPEVPRLLAQQGADLICSVNNWVWTPDADESGRSMAHYLTMTASHVNALPIVAANRIGSERDTKFLGGSVITGHDGWPIDDVAPLDEETIRYADLDVVASRTAKVWNDLIDLDKDRRTDLYDGLLGYRGSVRRR